MSWNAKYSLTMIATLALMGSFMLGQRYQRQRCADLLGDCQQARTYWEPVAGPADDGGNVVSDWEWQAMVSASSGTYEYRDGETWRCVERGARWADRYESKEGGGDE